MHRERDIQAYWGHMLVKIPQETLLQWPLPPRAHMFLETVGLPVDERLQYLNFAFNPSGVWLMDYRQEFYLVIGTVSFFDADGAIGLSIQTEECYLLDNRPNAAIPVQFINSNIEALLLFLKTALEYRSALHELTHKADALYQEKRTLTEEGRQEYRQLRDHINDLIEKLKQDFHNLDHRALVNSQISTYWSMYLAEFQ